jgi:hypothetical protein
MRQVDIINEIRTLLLGGSYTYDQKYKRGRHGTATPNTI